MKDQLGDTPVTIGGARRLGAKALLIVCPPPCGHRACVPMPAVLPDEMQLRPYRPAFGARLATGASQLCRSIGGSRLRARLTLVDRVHPPPFHLDHLMSDWPDCRIEVRCQQCSMSAFIPVRMLKGTHGDKTFRAILGALKCGGCGTRPAPIYLLASEHRTHRYGGPPGWAIELVPERG